MNSDINENLIKIHKYQLMSKLPNPFEFNDGSIVETTSQWQKRREEIYDLAVNLHYGGMPPKPEFLEVEPLCYGSIQNFRIKTGTRENPVIFDMAMFKAKGIKSWEAPVIISGDMCFSRMYDQEIINTVIKNGINFVMFNRTELAPDISSYNLSGLKEDSGEYKMGNEIWQKLQDGNCGGQIKKTYPHTTFSAVSAWAWGYSRCVDALEILGNVNTELIAFTGHSRGAKAAALAGATDERAAIVNPNATCCGGNSGYRIYIEAEDEKGEVKPSERLDNICRLFPAWMGVSMRDYIDREGELPFDSHFFKALVAPRVLFVSDGAHDIWGNPVGTWQTTEAAKEVYKFLGCEENIYWYFRPGGHNQTPEDIGQLVNLIKHVEKGEELNDKFFRLPFKRMEPAWDWETPKNRSL